MALKELEKNQTTTSAKLARLPSYDTDQLFFISFAQAWCGTSRPQSLRDSIESTPYVPAEYRVNGVAKNSAEFARVFACPAGTVTNTDNKCTMW